MARVASALKRVDDDGCAIAPRVHDLFEGMRVLVNTRGAEGVVFRTDGHNQLVVRELEARARTRRVLDRA